jgi:hypothetical protein
MRRHAKIQKYAVDRGNSRLMEYATQMDHIAVHDGHAMIVVEQLPGMLYGVRILVETEDATILSECTQQQTAVAASSERPVDVDPLRVGDEKLDRSFEKHRYVILRTIMLHHTPPMTRAATAS